MPDEITDKTLERVGLLIQRYATICGHTNAEVAHALLASKTLRGHGYTHEQRGRLTERQGQAALLVLNHWIGATIEQREHNGQPHP